MNLFKRVNITILWAIPLLLSSCATVLNNRVQRVRIDSDDPGVKVISVNLPALSDSSLTRPGKQNDYYIKRGKDPLLVTVQIDSVTKTITLKPKNSFAYWFNIYCNYGIGMLVDRNNPKRYAYPSRNYLEVNGTSVSVARFAPIKKGTVNFSLSFPFPGLFYMKSIQGKRSSAGVMGVETGIDYFYRDNQYLSLSFGAATDQFGEYLGRGYVQLGYNVFASVRNNHVVGRFDLGYGASFSELIWRNVTIGDTVKMNQTRRNETLGFSLHSNYRVGHSFRFGVLYQPGIFSIGAKPVLDYQHYISLNLIWKMPIRKII